MNGNKLTLQGLPKSYNQLSGDGLLHIMTWELIPTVWKGHAFSITMFVIPG